METRFDMITDTQIQEAEGLILRKESYAGADQETLSIAELARAMRWLQCWLGPPATFFSQAGLNFDGHHRVRAVKYVARQYGIQIQIPVRYDPKMK